MVYQREGGRTQRESRPQNKQMNINHLVMESFIGNWHLDGWMGGWMDGWIRFHVIGSSNVFANRRFPSSLMSPPTPNQMIEECSSRAWRMPLKSLIEFSLKRRVSFLFIQFSSVLYSNKNFIIIVIAARYAFTQPPFSLWNIHLLFVSALEWFATNSITSISTLCWCYVHVFQWCLLYFSIAVLQHSKDYY